MFDVICKQPHGTQKEVVRGLGVTLPHVEAVSPERIFFLSERLKYGDRRTRSFSAKPWDARFWNAGSFRRVISV
jgi:hypothetical protein